MATNDRTYYPSRTFDHSFAQLVRLCLDEGWTLPSVDLQAQEKEAAAQRLERQQHDAAQAAFRASHEAFCLKQEARWLTYASMLNGLRGRFRSDKAQLAKLEQFKRVVRRKAPAKSEPADG